MAHLQLVLSLCGILLVAWHHFHSSPPAPGISEMGEVVARVERPNAQGPVSASTLLAESLAEALRLARSEQLAHLGPGVTKSVSAALAQLPPQESQSLRYDGEKGSGSTFLREQHSQASQLVLHSIDRPPARAHCSLCIANDANGRHARQLACANEVALDRKVTDEEYARNQYLTDRSIYIVGAPFGDGQNLKGLEESPDALRKAGLKTVLTNIGWKVIDAGNPDLTRYVSDGIRVEKRSLHGVNGKPDPAARDGAQALPSQSRPTLTETYDDAAIHNSRTAGQMLRPIYEEAFKGVMQDRMTLTIGGDHSVAAASIAASLRRHPDLLVIWVDAHGDANTPETSPSKHYHGMPLAHLMGWFSKAAPGFEWMNDVPLLPETSVAFIGLRSVDPEEVKSLKRSRTGLYSMQAIDRVGIAYVMEDMLNKLDPERRRPIHLSFDIDVCDPSVAPGAGTKARGGLTYREAHYICETIADTNRLVSMDMVEVNPLLDSSDGGAPLHGDDPSIEGGETVRLAIELLASALGKTVL